MLYNINMKYILILGDGMSDTATPSPLSVAKKPLIDELATKAYALGLCQTVPPDQQPGSDVANMSILGYDPGLYYTGRSPLEALSMGINLIDGDLAIRCNLLSLRNPSGGWHGDCLDTQIMHDYSADSISSEDAAELIAYLNAHLPLGSLELYSGVSYRHCLVVRRLELPKSGIDTKIFYTPPHDIADRPIKDYLPGGTLRLLMDEAYKLLDKHPINIQRISAGKAPANSIWFWGQGFSPIVPSFGKLHGISGSMIAAVDLLKGLGLAAKMDVPVAPGATADINTDYHSMVDSALASLKTNDFTYIHIAAPDECGHAGDYAQKVKAIELIDSEVLAYMLPKLDKAYPDYTIILMPDHSTPVALKTHTRDSVPFMVYAKNRQISNPRAKFTETYAASTGLILDKGHTLLTKVISGKLV